MESWNENSFYEESYSEVKSMINEWFKGEYSVLKNNKIGTDELVTVKLCDIDTICHLYMYPINPVYIRIMCPTGGKFKQDEKGRDLYVMHVRIDSIDDSSYNIWFEEIPLVSLQYIRGQLIKYIDDLIVISVKDLLDKCVELGASPETKDYN